MTKEDGTCNPSGAINNASAEAGDIIQLGGYDWRVLDVKDGKAMILSDKIIARKEYGSTSTWENCDLRQYLNDSFFNTFAAEEKALIADTNSNPIYGTIGGIDTADKVFLLSVEEVTQYFGDSGQLASGRMYIDDEYNPARVARDKATGAASWWWLRSPGDPGNLAVCVGDDGAIYVTGHGVTVSGAGVGGVRPALWLNLEL